MEGATQLSTLIADLTTAVSGIFGMAGDGFDFVVGNPLGILMVGLSFAGASIGLVGRAFKTARR